METNYTKFNPISIDYVVLSDHTQLVTIYYKNEVIEIKGSSINGLHDFLGKVIKEGEQF